MDWSAAGTEGEDMLAILNEMRCNRQLVDVSILVQDVEYVAHKVVLASRSDYFRAMFTSGMLESSTTSHHQPAITLPSLTGRAFASLLHYMYTGQMDPVEDVDALAEVISAASHLQLPSALHTCSLHLIQWLTLSSCLYILRLASLYTLPYLHRHTLRFIASHFTQLLQSNDELLELDFDELRTIVSADQPFNCDEVELLMLVCKWLHHDPEQRLHHSNNLLSFMHFNEIDNSDARITTTMQKTLTMMIEGYFDVRCGRRGLVESLVVIGGIVYNEGPNHGVWVLDVDDDSCKWRLLATLPSLPQLNCGTVTNDEKLYIVGGSWVDPHTQDDDVHGYAWQYDVTTDKWSKLPPLITGRQGHLLCRLGGESRLHVFGGVGDVGAVERSCERLDAGNTKWSGGDLAPLPHNVYRFSGTTCKGKVYICGGMCDGGAISRHVITNEDGRLRDEIAMPTGGRVDHCVVGDDDGNYLYVLGGWSLGRTGQRHACTEVDRYDLVEKRWEAVTSLPEPRHSASAVIFEGSIWIVGGYVNCDGPPFRPLHYGSEILSYNLGSGEWKRRELRGCKPLNIWEHNLHTMLVPKKV